MDEISIFINNQSEFVNDALIKIQMCEKCVGPYNIFCERTLLNFDEIHIPTANVCSYKNSPNNIKYYTYVSKQHFCHEKKHTEIGLSKCVNKESSFFAIFTRFASSQIFCKHKFFISKCNKTDLNTQLDVKNISLLIYPPIENSHSRARKIANVHVSSGEEKIPTSGKINTYI